MIAWTQSAEIAHDRWWGKTRSALRMALRIATYISSEEAWSLSPKAARIYWLILNSLTYSNQFHLHPRGWESIIIIVMIKLVIDDTGKHITKERNKIFEGGWIILMRRWENEYTRMKSCNTEIQAKRMVTLYDLIRRRSSSAISVTLEGSSWWKRWSNMMALQRTVGLMNR